MKHESPPLTEAEIAFHKEFAGHIASGTPVTMPDLLDQNGTAAGMLATEGQQKAIARGDVEGRAVRAEAEVERLRAGIEDAFTRWAGYYVGGPDAQALDVLTRMWQELTRMDKSLRSLLSAPTEAGRER